MKKVEVETKDFIVYNENGACVVINNNNGIRYNNFFAEQIFIEIVNQFYNNQIQLIYASEDFLNNFQKFIYE